MSHITWCPQTELVTYHLEKQSKPYFFFLQGNLLRTGSTPLRDLCFPIPMIQPQKERDRKRYRPRKVRDIHTGTGVQPSEREDTFNLALLPSPRLYLLLIRQRDISLLTERPSSNMFIFPSIKTSVGYWWARLTYREGCPSGYLDGITQRAES